MSPLRPHADAASLEVSLVAGARHAKKRVAAREPAPNHHARSPKTGCRERNSTRRTAPPIGEGARRGKARRTSQSGGSVGDLLLSPGHRPASPPHERNLRL